MEVQLTDYENAAFSVFVVLLTRAIMTLGLNFYLPISKVRAPPLWPCSLPLPSECLRLGRKEGRKEGGG